MMDNKKTKIEKYLMGLYKLLLKKQYIKGSFYTFKVNWQNGDYRRGMCRICIELLYEILEKDYCKLHIIHKAIHNECGGSIVNFIHSTGFITGSVTPPAKGLSRLGWDILSRLESYDIDYFTDLRESLLKGEARSLTNMYDDK